MRPSLLPLLLPAALAAQSPLSLPFGGNNGLGAGSQIYFDLDVVNPAGITLTRLDVNCSTTAVGTVGTIEVYIGPSTYVGNELNPAAWTLAAIGGVVAQGNNVPSFTCIGQGVYLPPGQHGVVVRHVGVSMRYFDTGATVYANADVTYTGGAAHSAFFSGSLFSPRIFNGNLYYNVGNVPGVDCAAATRFGNGCYAGTTTFYQLFPSLLAFDLAGAPGNEQVLVATPIGPGGYIVLPGTPAWYAPTGSQVLNNAATPAAMGDNAFSQPLNLPFSFPFPGGATTVIHAASNGYVNLLSTTSNSSDLSPTVAELLAQAARLCPLWCDLNPAGNVTTNAASGIYFDVDPSGQIVYVTWLDVADRRGGAPAAGATSVNVQVALHSSGMFEFRYRNLVPKPNVLPAIVGWSKGNSDGLVSLDPGSSDLNGPQPVLTSGPDSRPLVHTAGVPRLGLNFVLSVSDVPNLLPAAILMAGDLVLDPGLDLGFLGAPGCELYQNANILTELIPVALPAGTGSYTVAIPGVPTLIGATVGTQMAAASVQNQWGITWSNGIRVVIGL